MNTEMPFIFCIIKFLLCISIIHNGLYDIEPWVFASNNNFDNNEDIHTCFLKNFNNESAKILTYICIIYCFYLFIFFTSEKHVLLYVFGKLPNNVIIKNIEKIWKSNQGFIMHKKYVHTFIERYINYSQ